jgi:hypothetical protein
MTHACNPNYSGGRDQKNQSSKQDPILKKTQNKNRAGVVAQVVQHLPSKSSSPSTIKKKKRRKKEFCLEHTKFEVPIRFCVAMLSKQSDIKSGPKEEAFKTIGIGRIT